MNHNDSTLIEPIEFFRNRYAPRFPELNALVFPVISPETRAPGKYIITGSGEREFLPDIICHRQFIISKIQDKTVIPSQSLIDTLKINQWELDPKPMPYLHLHRQHRFAPRLNRSHRFPARRSILIRTQ